MRPALALALVLVSGCGSLGAFQTPAVLAPGKVRVGFEAMGAGASDGSLPDAALGMGAFRLDAGLGRGVEASVLGGPVGGGAAVKVGLPATRVRSAVFAGASRFSYPDITFGPSDPNENRVTAAYAGVSAGSRVRLPNGGDPFFLWPYVGARVLYIDARDVNVDDGCETCVPEVKRFRRLMPAVSLGLAFAETIGARLEASVGLAPEPVVMFGFGVRF